MESIVRNWADLTTADTASRRDFAASMAKSDSAIPHHIGRGLQLMLDHPCYFGVNVSGWCGRPPVTKVDDIATPEQWGCPMKRGYGNQYGHMPQPDRDLIRETAGQLLRACVPTDLAATSHCEVILYAGWPAYIRSYSTGWFIQGEEDTTLEMHIRKLCGMPSTDSDPPDMVEGKYSAHFLRPGSWSYHIPDGQFDAAWMPKSRNGWGVVITFGGDPISHGKPKGFFTLEKAREYAETKLQECKKVENPWAPKEPKIEFRESFA